jgi:site-specific recombinase XerD
MAEFRVERDGGGVAPFRVIDGDGTPVAAASRFLEDLAVRGRSSYTIRSYALGLAGFLAWLAHDGLTLDTADRATVVRYMDWFRRGDGRPRAVRTVNHRVSVLSSWFRFLIDHDVDGWAGRRNPVGSEPGVSHGMTGRDAQPHRRLGELRQTEPRRMPAMAASSDVEALIEAAGSWRDRALFTLLWRTGQRIGDWSDVHGRHGILGLVMFDLVKADPFVDEHGCET